MGMSVSEVVVEPRLIFSHHVLRGQYLLQAGTVGGGALGWFRQVLGRPDATFEALSAEAATAPAGSGGVVFLPYLAGERTPIWSTAARGVFLGLSYATTRAEMLRSIMEGCAFAVLDNLRVAEATGVRVTEWLATGGAARSPLWNQIKADVQDGRWSSPGAQTGARAVTGSACSRSPRRRRGSAEVPARRSNDSCRDARRSSPTPDDTPGMERCSRSTTTRHAGCCRSSTASRRCHGEGRGPRRRAAARPIARSPTRCPPTGGAARGSGERGVRVGHPPLPARTPDVPDDPRPRGGGHRVGGRARRRCEPGRAPRRARAAGAVPRLCAVPRRPLLRMRHVLVHRLPSRRRLRRARRPSRDQPPARAGRRPVRGRRADRAVHRRAPHAGPRPLRVRGHGRRVRRRLDRPYARPVAADPRRAAHRGHGSRRRQPRGSAGLLPRRAGRPRPRSR